MTKYDIKFRRNALTKGRIERHKDFRSLQQMMPNQGEERSTKRLWIILFALVAIVGMIGLGIWRSTEVKEQQETTEPVDIFDEFKTE